MFAALWHITSNSKSSYVTFEEWCRFWFRGPKKYSTTSLPQVLKDFSALGTSKPLNDSVHEAFVILDIPEEHLLHSWQASRALSCALRLRLVGAIYFRSHRMGVHDFVGAPMIAFHGTDAIKTLSHKEAKSSIYSGQDINWVIIAPNDTTSVKYVDNSMQSQQVIDFLLSVRSCFLTLRYENNCIAEPYSPHRFSRQFGFYQDIPGKLKPPPEKKEGEANLKRGKLTNTPPHDKDAKATCDSYRLVVPKNQLCEVRKVIDRDLLVAHPRMESPLKTKIELCFKTSLMELTHATKLYQMKNKSFGAIDEDLLAAASDPIVLYAASTIIARNSEVVHDAPPIQTAAPSFKAQDMISEADRYAVGFLVKQMNTRLLHTPLNNIPVLDPELKELLGYIASNSIDITSLREHVEAYVSHARSFHALDSSENVQPSLSSLEE
ncbi:TD and POZ domain-containing protein 5 [Bienertia sinuspersici]